MEITNLDTDKVVQLVNLISQPTENTLVGKIKRMKRVGQVHPIKVVVYKDNTLGVLNRHLDFLAIKWLHEHNQMIPRVNKGRFCACINPNERN